MSALAGLSQADSKKILRIALIGVSPADQMILKGYVRILLRLKFDFEWVSSSHPNIDLLMINKDLRHSSNTIKLLNEQQHQSVLYISRTETNNGEMIDDNIVLPLRKLDDLNRWLNKSIFMPIASLEEHNQYSKSEPINQPSTFSTNINSELLISDDQIDLYDAPTPQNSRLNDSNDYIDETSDSHRAVDSNRNHQNIISLIQTLQQRPLGFYQIATTDQALAIVEPKRARVWLLGSKKDSMLPTLTTDWQLREYKGQLPNDDQAYDMIQWLWQCAWQKIEILLPLVNDDNLYQLRYWIKPVFRVDHNAIKNQKAETRSQGELLKILTELESQPRNVNELSSLAGVSVNTAKKIIASLLFSGSLQAQSYHNIDTLITIQYDNLATDNVEAQPSTLTTTSSAFTDIDTRSTFDKLLDQRARQQASKSNTSGMDTGATKTQDQPLVDPKATNPDIKENSNKQQKIGFLSRLRQKLGL